MPVDLVAERELYVTDIRRLCVASVFSDVRLWVSTRSFVDAYHVLHMDATSLITRDEEMAKKSPVPALTAKEFLDRMEEEYGSIYENIHL